MTNLVKRIVINGDTNCFKPSRVIGIFSPQQLLVKQPGLVEDRAAKGCGTRGFQFVLVGNFSLRDRGFLKYRFSFSKLPVNSG